jgi:hypothetical protein
VPAYPWCKDCKTLTGGWFRYGIGPHFPQITGGDIGIPLRQLVDDYIAGKVDIPIGALIVADGHAALFDGVIKIGSQMEFITYDANFDKDHPSGWRVSVLTGAATQGTAGQDDFGVIQLKFGGQQVGEHATRLQWQDSTSVKVYQFIGNPTLHIEDPWSLLQRSREAQCQQDMQIANQAKSTACSPGHQQDQCDAARAQFGQALLRCSTPVYLGSLP